MEPVNLNEVPEGAYISEPGEYDVKITAAKEVASRQKGTPGITVTLTDAYGRTMRDTFWLVPAALWRLAQIADAAGLSTEQKEKFSDPDILIGLDVNVTTEPDGTYLKVVKYESAKQPVNIIEPEHNEKPELPF